MDESFRDENEKEAREHMREKVIWVSFCILGASLLWAVAFSG